MDRRNALVAIQKGEKLDQETLLRLHDEGLIELVDVTHFQSPGREYIAGLLTAKGLRLVEIGSEATTAAMGKPIGAGEAMPAGRVVKRWDVFISYAHEDKEEFVHGLAEALKNRGYEVWYDSFSLKLGDSLRESIDRGLIESRFGVVVLSQNFFAKHWTNRELNGLAAIEVAGEKVILPLWHGVTHADVVEYSPILADRKAINTMEGIDRVVAAIEQVVNPPLAEDLHEKLDAAEERLQEYRCSYCGAPLSERASVQLSENDSGTAEAFECGYSHVDGSIQRRCPSDPKFPRLQDYEFTYREVTGDAFWKWECFATGKTEEARALMLMRAPGSTQEEARQRVIDSYNGYAKPWRRR
jgi:hypothetical protein